MVDPITHQNCMNHVSGKYYKHVTATTEAGDNIDPGFKTCQHMRVLTPMIWTQPFPLDSKIHSCQTEINKLKQCKNRHLTHYWKKKTWTGLKYGQWMFVVSLLLNKKIQYFMLRINMSNYPT